MSTHVEWLAPRVEVVGHATTIGENEVEEPLAIVFGDDGDTVGVIQGDQPTLVGLLTRALALFPVTGWLVVNNVTGQPMSVVYSTEESANRICAHLNTPIVGGLYGVREVRS